MASEGKAGGGKARRTASNFFAGAAAGVFADLLTYPLDAAATHAQSGTRAASVRGLYRGFGVAAALTAPGYAVYFGAYDAVQRGGGQHAALAGCCAEAGGGLFFVPCEVLKKRAVLGRAGYARLRALPRTVARLVRAEGARALYAGYGASVAAWMPFSAVYFWAFETLRARVLAGYRVQDLACGGVAGAAAALVTAPVDLVATRVQTRHRGARSVAHAVRDIAREGGVRPFFTGAVARVVWLAPQCAVTIAGFEFLKRTFDT